LSYLFIKKILKIDIKIIIKNSLNSFKIIIKKNNDKKNIAIEVLEADKKIKIKKDNIIIVIANLLILGFIHKNNVK
tara:strand:- start:68 stop:295 length:228 start_codon:yes stop_codon:yes gene_type:complete